MPFLILLVFGADHCLLQGQFILSTVIIDKSTTKDVVKGNLYVVNEQVLLFEVSDPVNQLMWFKPDTVDIYYPEERKLFRILSHDTLPTRNTTISGVLNMDFEHQLHLAGLKVYKARRSADTIMFYWEFKQSSRNTSRNTSRTPEIVTGRIGEDLVLYRAQVKGLKIEFQLGKYETLDTKRYPSFLRSVVEQGKMKKIEELRLSGVKTNTPLPKHLADFKIPADATVKTVEW
jgi:hypothetical protein